MTTGFTYELVENGQTLEQFVMGCARSFIGPMRNINGPIPTKFKADSYYKDELTASQKKLAKLKAMDAKQRLAYGEKVKREVIAAEKQFIAQLEKESQRISDMIAQVKAWKVPSVNHKKLKAFMLNHLQEELRDVDVNTHHQRIKDAEAVRPHSYWNDSYNRAKQDVRYYTNEMKQELKGVTYINTWVKQLRGSL
jgi:spore germination protein GerM